MLKHTDFPGRIELRTVKDGLLAGEIVRQPDGYWKMEGESSSVTFPDPVRAALWVVDPLAALR